MLKILSFLTDLVVLLLFCQQVRFFNKIKSGQRLQRNNSIDPEEDERLKRKHKIVLGWIYFVIVFNVFYLFYKCFMRTVTVLVNDPSGNPDAFDHMHKYRFVIFSVADIMSGLSVLYCFHSMASLARKQRISSSQQQTMSTGDNNNDMR